MHHQLTYRARRQTSTGDDESTRMPYRKPAPPICQPGTPPQPAADRPPDNRHGSRTTASAAVRPETIAAQACSPGGRTELPTCWTPACGPWIPSLQDPGLDRRRVTRLKRSWNSTNSAGETRLSWTRAEASPGSDSAVGQQGCQLLVLLGQDVRISRKRSEVASPPV